MCGIWAFLQKKQLSRESLQMAREGWMTLTARGPDAHAFVPFGPLGETGPVDQMTGILGFTRLAINGLGEAGDQPFQRKLDGANWMQWICNGEIYNTRELEGLVGKASTSGSDCEVLGSLWSYCAGDATAFARSLDGVFALILIDQKKQEVVIARDPFGVRPLFWMETEDGFYFASERKALEPSCGPTDRVVEFPPGHTMHMEFSGDGVWSTDLQPYFTVPWIRQPHLSTEEAALAAVRDSLMAAVKKRLLAERPIAALLSGGLDSSLIAALVQRELQASGRPPLETFSIGMRGSSDLAFARTVADWIGSNHTEVVVTADEMFDSIPDVVEAIESYDITSVRASVGNWMVAREVSRSSEAKVVFNGDGSDELFGSYLYCYNAPTPLAYETEVERLLTEIHRYDVLRSDRSISSHGLEARTPFLDKQFVATVLACPTWMRQPIRSGSAANRPEKWLLRKAFESMEVLPPEVLWRKKEAFSDGVSSTEKAWYEEIQERIAARRLVGPDWRAVLSNYPFPPTTEESAFYRMLYERDYQHTGDPVRFWLPRWSPETSDPSARTLRIYT